MKLHKGRFILGALSKDWKEQTIKDFFKKKKWGVPSFMY
jgi:hypothetical protein